MKLYYSPGACSLSPHIVLLESGLAFETEKVNLTSKQTAGGNDYNAINPKGSVPALQLDDGNVLTEGPAIVQYLADCVPDKRLVPPTGTLERYRVMEWLNYISTELHKTFTPLFDHDSAEPMKQWARDTLARQMQYLAPRLAASPFAMGARFTVVDAYLFTVLRWTRYVSFDLNRWPSVERYVQRLAQHPSVAAALIAEGLMPKAEP